MNEKKCKQITEFRNSTKAKLFFIEHKGVTASTCFIKRMLKPLGHKRCLNVNSVSLMSPLYTPNSWISKILICCQCYFFSMNPTFPCVLWRYFGYMTNSIQLLQRKKYLIISKNIFNNMNFQLLKVTKSKNRNNIINPQL